MRIRRTPGKEEFFEEFNLPTCRDADLLPRAQLQVARELSQLDDPDVAASAQVFIDFCQHPEQREEILQRDREIWERLNDGQKSVLFAIALPSHAKKGFLPLNGAIREELNAR